MRWMIALALALAVVSAGIADPRTWDHNGVAVRNSAGLQWDGEIARRNDGSALAVWAEARGDQREIFGQLFAADGDAQWEKGGRLLARGVQGSAIFASVDTTANGWLLCWFDITAIYEGGDVADEAGYMIGTVRGTKLNLQGDPVWPDSARTGLLLSPEESNFTENSLNAISDGTGGAYYIWGPDHTGEGPHVQRVASDGAFAWPQPVNLGDSIAYSFGLKAIGDGQGNLIVSWLSYTPSNSLKVAKITPEGTMPWGAAGIVISNSTTNFRQQIASDGIGGMYVAWLGTSIYAQRINENGAAYWQAGGVDICPASGDAQSMQIAPCETDGAVTGLIAVWEDRRVNGWAGEIFAQKISSAGTTLWAPEGIRVCGDAMPGNIGHERFSPRLTSDGMGGIVCLWKDTRDSPYYNPDSYAARINADGQFVWGQDCGLPVATNHVNQTINLVCTGNVFHVFWGEWPADLVKVKENLFDLANGISLRPQSALLSTGMQGGNSNPKVVTLSEGRVAMVWKDRRNWQTEELYYQIVDSAAQFKFRANGIPLAPAQDSVQQWQSDQSLCADGAGGFFAAFGEFSVSVRIRVVHVNANGERIADTADEYLYQNQFDQLNPRCVSDGAGGCFVAARVFDSDFYIDTHVIRVNSQCDPMWSESVALGEHELDDDVFGIVQSTDHSCIVGWRSGNFNSYTAHAARISQEGVVIWQVQLTDTTRDVEDLSIVSDHEGGAYWVWTDNGLPDLTGRDIFAQHVTAEGAVSWQHNGLPVVMEEGVQYQSAAAVDNLGNLVVVWENYDGEYAHIYGQRILPSGERTWPDNGQPVCTADDFQSDPEIIALNSETFYVTWMDYRESTNFNFDAEIYATLINSGGEATGDSYWEEESGGALSDHGSRVWNTPVSAPDGVGGVLTVWMDDRRHDFDYALYGQHIFDPVTLAIDHEPEIASVFSLDQNYPNPFNPSTEIVYSLATNAHTSLKIFDITGREVKTLVDQVITAGEHKTIFDAAGLPSGVYFYQLKAGDLSTARKMVLIR